LKRLFAIVSGGILCQALSTNCLAQGNGIKLDGSTTPDKNPASLSADSNGVINIDAAIGHGAGGNLFHSFETFNVDSGQTAEFTDLSNAGNPNPVYDNVIARISGNQPSEIFGGIKTGAGLDGANLFLINPNGILFGQGASVSIGGAFYASTADTVVFSDAVNSELTMDAGDMHFSSAPIAAFGFTNVSDQASVNIQNTNLDFKNDLNVYADTIQIGNSSVDIATEVNVNNGNASLVAAAAGSKYQLSQQSTLTDASAGQIAFDKASLSVNGDNNIVLRGGKLTLANGSNIILSNSGALSDTSQTAIDIQMTAKLDLDQSLIHSTTASGVSGDIRINSDEINISNGGLLVSGVTGKVRGNISTGNIDVHANRISITGITLNQANANDVNIVPPLTGIAAIAGVGLDQSSGSIHIVANDIYMAHNGSISSTNYGSNPGDISMSEASANGRLRMESGAKISFRSQGFSKSLASGANIDIQFSQISLTGADSYTGSNEQVSLSPTATSIENFAYNNVENGGDIHINANTFSLTNSARIQGKSSQDGLGANIDINAKSIFIAGVDANYQAYFLSRDSEVGAGISVDHSAGNSPGNLPNGSINLRADSIEISNKGYITVTDQNIGGYSASGNIGLQAKNIRISDAKISSSNYQFNYDAPSSNIDVIASESLYISNSVVSTNITSPNGNSGNINLSGDQVAIFTSRINTSADIGNGGNINISGKFGIISADTYINAHSNQSIDGIISISNNILFESRSALSIASRKSETIVLSDLCSSDNNEQSSLTVNNNNRPLLMENVDFLTTHFSQPLNYGLANINDCMHPSIKVSLL